MPNNQQILLTPLQLKDHRLQPNTQIMITLRPRRAMGVRVRQEPIPLIRVQGFRFVRGEPVPDSWVDLGHLGFLDDFVATVDEGPGGVMSSSAG